MIEGIVNYFGQVFIITVEVIALLLLPGLIIGSILQFLTSKLRNKTASMTGHKFFIYFSFLGTVVHELGHAFFCKVFRHKITDMKLFSPSDDGTLGYVAHSFNPKSRYQRIGNFFIGIGPIWFGAFIIFILTKMLFPEAIQELEINNETGVDIGFVESCWKMLIASLKGVGILFTGEHYKHWTMYVWLYLTLSIGFHLTLSSADIKGAKSGFFTLIITIFTINLFTAWMGTPLLLWFGDFRGIYGILLFTLVLVSICCIILFILRTFKPMTKLTIWIYKKMPST